jgi:hypothetical protein
MASNERRRHVRVKPSPDLPVQVALASDALLREAVHVMDLSVCGLALASLATTETGQQLRLHLRLGSGPEHTVDVIVRWTTRDTAGVELVDPTPQVAQELARYVAELLERGGSS